MGFSVSQLISYKDILWSLWNKLLIKLSQFLILGASSVVPTGDYGYGGYPQYSGGPGGYGYGYSATTCGLLSK